MKAAIKKKVLFNFLKKHLSEARSDYTFYSDGSFLGKFKEEEGQGIPFVDSDVPLRANPAASHQLHVDNFDVSDPDFLPSSKSGLISAAAAILDHVPDRQVEFAYEEMHRLLDRVMEKEDEINYGAISEVLSSLIRQKQILNEMTERQRDLLMTSAQRVFSGNLDVSTEAERLSKKSAFSGLDANTIQQMLFAFVSSPGDLGVVPDDEDDDYIPPPPPPPRRRMRRTKAEREAAEKKRLEDEAASAERYRAQAAAREAQLAAEREQAERESVEREEMERRQEIDSQYTDDDHEAAVAAFLAQAEPKAPPPRAPTFVPSQVGRSVIRRRKKQPEEIESVPVESVPEDLSYDDQKDYDRAEDKDAFMKGYNVGQDDAANDKEIEDVSSFGVDFAAGYEAGYDDMTPGKRVGQEAEGSFEEEDLEVRLAQRDQFGDSVPHVLRLIPEFYMLCKDIGYKIETDRYNLMMSGDDPKSADRNIRQVYNISHVETFINHNLLKTYFTKDYAMKSAKKHFDVINSGTFSSPAATAFREGFMSALPQDNIDEEEAKSLMVKVYVEKILDDVSNYNFEPDKNKKLETLLRSEFAATTVYKTGPSAGAGGSKRSEAKPYQGNTSATFHRRVKEEFRSDIIEDFLDRLTNKYLSGDAFKIPSGRKDPENPKRNEKYKFNPDEFRSAAEKYANDLIDKALQDQAEVAKGKVFVPEDEVVEDEILGDEDSPDSMSDEEIAEKLSNTKEFDTLAPFFGFSGAPGMRQWFLKFSKRFFEMGIISAKSGDRTLLKFHSEMVEAVLETLSESLPVLMRDLVDDDDGSGKYKEMMAVLSRMAPQIEDAYQEFLDIGDELTDITVDAKLEDGSFVPMNFLNTLGGQLARTVNGMFFKKVLTKLDKAWTDYVASELQTNEQFKNYIANNVAQSAGIDAKVAKSVAEYFIGKKNAPEIVRNKKTKKHDFKSSIEGNPTKGVKTLMKYGIDAEAYHIINQESREWFEDMLMTDFARKMVDGGMFEGQYRQMIMKEYEKLRKNKNNFKKVILSALEDVITGSAQRTALSNLSDYEVQ